jgi:2-amino-4-hydroxy-6-hydroxymethyldihydropteridine diphosphokinase
MSQMVAISLGSNLGDRPKNLQQALKKLKGLVRIRRRSSLYETDPWGYTDQPKFLNQVIVGISQLGASDLLRRLKQIEQDMGRQATFQYGPRLIDLDLLYYGETILHTNELDLPHPRLHERAFVLVPLAEIAPNWVHPILKRPTRDLLTMVSSEGVRLYNAD